MAVAVEAIGLATSFRAVRALDGVSLTVDRGSVLGLLGPNGAGKSTAVRVLSTLQRPDAGTARVCGFDVVREADAVRASIGLAGQYAGVDDNLTGQENLRLVGRLLELSRRDARTRADQLLDRFDLTDAATRPVRTYSGGMRRRLDLAAALVHAPRVLFLDEPTTGLDPRSRLTLWQVVEDLAADGVTVLLTTQYLEEADRLADHIAVIDHGRVIAEGTAPELTSRHAQSRIEVEVAEPDLGAALAALGLGPEAARAHADGFDLHLAVSNDGDRALAEIVTRLVTAGVVPVAARSHAPTLDDVFLSLTGQPAESAATADPAADLGRSVA